MKTKLDPHKTTGTPKNLHFSNKRYERKPGGLGKDRGLHTAYKPSYTVIVRSHYKDARIPIKQLIIFPWSIRAVSFFRFAHLALEVWLNDGYSLLLENERMSLEKVTILKEMNHLEIINFPKDLLVFREGNSYGVEEK